MEKKPSDTTLVLSCVLLVVVIAIFVVVLILAKLLYQLVTSINERLQFSRVKYSYTNPANEIELDEQKEPETPSIFPRRPRPISGTSAWLTGSMESVVIVPSRQESPKQRFQAEENSPEVKTSLFEASQMQADN